MARQKAAPARDTPSTEPPAPYTVLARRYRPQQFADLIGQEAVAQALVNALTSGRVAHAYLFTGARGVGKTSAARILAKALNCVKGPTPTPCDVCDICKSITSGEDVDVLEIDGASNRRIDEIRDIRSGVQYRPSRTRYKIYIIDEVHMLTREAFNALLKTLEEPPAHVKFIFATTEVDKVPITILSRCQRFDFSSIGTPRIMERLRSIVAAEGLKADDDALEMIARRAGGSMRDSQSLLDQLLAFGGDRLTADAVHRLLGTADDDRVMALAEAVLTHDACRVLELVEAAAAEGLQLGELVDQLLTYWRDLMVLNCSGAEARGLSVAPRHREVVQKQAQALKLDTILAGLDILSSTRGRLRTTNHGRVLVEMALVRLGRLDDLVSLSQVAQWLSTPGAVASAPRAPEASPPVKKKPLSAPETPNTAGPTPLTAQTLSAVWADVLSQVGHFLGRTLEKAGLPAIIGPNALVLRFPARYNAEYEDCKDPTRQQRVEDALQRITGQSYQVRLESVGNGAAPQPEVTGTNGSAAPPRSRLTRADAVEFPLLKRAIETLGASVVHVDEDFGSAVSASVRTNADSEET